MPPTALTPFKFGSFIGSAISTGAGFAAGGATARTLRPILQGLENETWARLPVKPLSPETAALAEIEGIWSHTDAVNEAGNTGISPERYEAVRRVSDEGITLGLAFEAWRRDQLTDDQFDAALRKARIETRWWGPIKALKSARLTPAQIALGIVRSLIKDPGFLPVTLDISGGKVPRYGVSTIDGVGEAEDAGITAERLRVMVGEIGLPMSLQSAASAVFRNIIERADFNLAVLEGDTRPEWADAIFEQAREIPSARDFVQAHLRGWIDEEAMYAGTALHGMSHHNTDLLYLRSGRPAAPGQMATAAARGIDGPDGRPMDKAQFLKGIRQSDIRPEWGEMLWDSRFLYPPLFQLTRLVQGGAIDADTAREWAVKDRYPPEVVTALHKYWSQGTVAKADPHVGRAATQLWSTTHRAYLAGDATEADATAKLAQVGVAAAAIAGVIGLWNHERELSRARLTPSQVKKAWTKAAPNEATGQPWTYDDALAELISRGWPHLDATTFLKQ